MVDFCVKFSILRQCRSQLLEYLHSFHLLALYRVTRSCCSLLLQHSVFFLLIFSPRSSIAFLHSSSFLSTSPLMVLHSTMSSAKNMHQGGCSLMPRPSTSMTKSKRYELSEDPWCSPTQTVIVLVSPTLLLTFVPAFTYVSLTILTHFPGTPSTSPHLLPSYSIIGLLQFDEHHV